MARPHNPWYRATRQTWYVEIDGKQIPAKLDLGIWVLPIHKTGKKTGKPRTVYLTETMAEMTRELAKKNPSGGLGIRVLNWDANGEF